LRNIGWIGFLDKQLRQMGLGILATIVGYLLGFISLILALPILVGQFVTPYKLSQNKFYFDEIYTFLIVRPLELFAVVFAWLDRWVVDGLVNLVGSLPRIGGNLMRPMQSGQVQFYALIMAVGVVLLILAQAFAR
jgi:NADH-quinone oxidoreductase subunit L